MNLSNTLLYKRFLQWLKRIKGLRNYHSIGDIFVQEVIYSQCYDNLLIDLSCIFFFRIYLNIIINLSWSCGGQYLSEAPQYLSVVGGGRILSLFLKFTSFTFRFIAKNILTWLCGRKFVSWSCSHNLKCQVSSCN